MTEKKNEIIHCRVDLTPIEKDGEGQLRGGFVGISGTVSPVPKWDLNLGNCHNCTSCNTCPGATTTPAPTSTSKSSKVMMDFFSGGLF